MSQAPPKGLDSEDLFLQITAMPRPHHVVDYPRKRPDGSPVGKLAMVVLTNQETQSATAAAEKFTRKTLGDQGALPARGEPSEGYSTMFANRASVEVLVRACRRVDNMALPFFPGADAIAKALTLDEVDVLFSAYAAVRYELGPIVKSMTEVEYDAWIEALGKGASSVPLAPMTSDLRSLLLLRMARDLWISRTGNSSLGEPAGCDSST